MEQLLNNNKAWIYGEYYFVEAMYFKPMFW